MKEQRLNTLKAFINSNKSFFCALENNEPPYLDDYLKVELLLIYFNNNLPYIKMHYPRMYDLISSMLSTSNYYIENGNICYEDHIYSIVSLENLAMQIADYIKDNAVENCNNDFDITTNDCKIYTIKQSRNHLDYDMSDRELMFQYTTTIDQDTLPYINKVKTDFNRFINFVCLHLLKHDFTPLDYRHLQVIYAYFNLYPSLLYGRDLIEVPFEVLNIPQNKIGLAKITHSHPAIVNLNKKLKEITIKLKALYAQHKLLLDNNLGTSYTVKKRINELEHQETSILNQIFINVHHKNIYNSSLLKYALKSFIQGFADINNLFHNPVIKLFYIADNDTEFFCAMHLDTLINLIDNDRLLNLIDDHPVLMLTS